MQGAGKTELFCDHDGTVIHGVPNVVNPPLALVNRLTLLQCDASDRGGLPASRRSSGSRGGDRVRGRGTGQQHWDCARAGCAEGTDKATSVVGDDASGVGGAATLTGASDFPPVRRCRACR